MSVVIVVFLVMLFIVLAMSVGVLFGGKPIKGSCGGLSAIGMKSACEVCAGKDEECERKKEKIKLKQLDQDE
ncbi:MAG: (Na+)-NQR maturation NqrM [Pseudomonadales bacterium]|nr:(Na+)-NQR maturation NqrM [Pseudomonadales bacterium]